MIKYFTKAFKLTNENIILTTPLVLFLLLFFIYLGIAKSTTSNMISEVLLTVTVLFMFGAFFAGWLYMVKHAIALDKETFETDEEKSKASFLLIKKLPVGIGEYFFSFISAIILYTFLLALMYICVFKIGNYLIGNIGLSINDMNLAFSSPAMMHKALTGLSHTQLVRFSSWIILLFTSIMAFYFFTMYWFIEIVVGTKNPLFAFGKSLKFIFRHPLDSIVLFIYVAIINFIITYISNLLAINAATQFISMLISFYFVVYVVVLIFLYYDSTISRELEITTAKSETTEEAISDNSNSGTDSIGEEQSGDSDSKED